VFTVPERCTAASGAVPTAREVAPWVATIQRLWDDPEFEARYRALSRAEAPRWDWDRVAEQYERFFEGLSIRPGAKAGASGRDRLAEPGCNDESLTHGQ